MPSTGKIFTYIFITTAIFMLVLDYTAPNFEGRSLTMRAAALLFFGLILSTVLTAIVSALVKRPEPETAKVKAPEAIPAPVTMPPAEKVSFDPGVVQALSMLQKEGRLVDFLQEEISGFDDRQVGAAVRNIHKECRKTLADHVDIAPVLTEREGDETVIKVGFDPSAIRLTGNVIGSPPFRGTVRHSGWKVTATRMPPFPKHQDPHIIEPAEVEIK